MPLLYLPLIIYSASVSLMLEAFAPIRKQITNAKDSA